MRVRVNPSPSDNWFGTSRKGPPYWQIGRLQYYVEVRMKLQCSGSAISVWPRNIRQKCRNIKINILVGKQLLDTISSIPRAHKPRNVHGERERVCRNNKSTTYTHRGVARSLLRGDKRGGMGDGSPPAGCRGREAPEAGDTCWIFDWTKYITRNVLDCNQSNYSPRIIFSCTFALG